MDTVSSANTSNDHSLKECIFSSDIELIKNPSVLEETTAQKKIANDIPVDCSPFNCPIPLRDKLMYWYMKNQPTRQSVEELLKILKEENLDVPLSLKALMPNSEKAIIKQMSPGFYSHFGIRNQITFHKHLISQDNEITIDINIDGLPLFKSSRVQLWPILIKMIDVQIYAI